MAAAISTAALTKRFGRATAVDAVDLDVPAGSVYGFLGPNGSGKTTTIRVLLGLVHATSGTYRLLADDTGADALTRVGALVEGPAFHPYLSGWENLRRLDAADRSVDPHTSRTRIADSLERVGLTAAAGKRYRVYSLGMRQRLGIAAALLRSRELLILDEPTNGLDPQGTREVRDLVADLASSGVTVFLSSHLLREVEQICTDVGVMSAGRLVWQGRLDELRAGGAARVRVETPDVDTAARVLRAQGLPQPRSEHAAASAELGGRAAEDIAAALVGAGVRVRGFVVEQASLEQRYVELTGAGFDVSG